MRVSIVAVLICLCVVVVLSAHGKKAHSKCGVKFKRHSNSSRHQKNADKRPKAAPLAANMTRNEVRSIVPTLINSQHPKNVRKGIKAAPLVINKTRNEVRSTVPTSQVLYFYKLIQMKRVTKVMRVFK